MSRAVSYLEVPEPRIVDAGAVVPECGVTIGAAELGG